MRFFLLNTFGFFLDFFPSALMVFLPFPQEALRFRRGRIFAGVALASAALAALFPLTLLTLYSLAGVRTIQAIHAAANLYSVCTILMGLAAYVCLVREAMLKKVLVVYIVMFYQAIQYWLINTIDSPSRRLPLYHGAPLYFCDEVVLLKQLALMVVLLPLELMAVIRPLGEFIREIEPRKMRREFAIAVISTTACYILMIYFDTVWPTVLPLTPLCLLLIFDQNVIYWLVFRESVRRKHDYERQRFLEVQRVQYDRLAGEMENTRRLRHDLRHHLNVLGALNAQGRQDEITEYLKQYGAVYDHLSRQKFSGDPVVDGVLEYYLAMAGDEEINVTCRVSLSKEGSGVDAVDMTVLLGNCLENAMKAMRPLPVEDRRLSIEMAPARSMILLRVQNTCARSGGSGEPAGWEAFAVQRGKDLRSVGLHSITVIAEKYGGSAQFQRQDGVFTTRVILNPKQSRSKRQRPADNGPEGEERGNRYAEKNVKPKQPAAALGGRTDGAGQGKHSGRREDVHAGAGQHKH